MPDGLTSLIRAGRLVTLIALFGAFEGRAQSRSTKPAISSPPICDLGGPYSGTPGSPIEFDGSRSHDPDGTILIYRWDFGDGTSALGRTAIHAFGFEGIHRVTLTTVDSQSDSTSCSSEVPIAFRSTRDMTTPEDLLDAHRIVFQGAVVSSITNRTYTEFEISAQEYFAGSGPGTARVHVKAVDTDEIQTIAGERIWSLPKIGDSAIFWIFHHQQSAVIRGPRAIWIIKADYIPALGLSLAEAKLGIKAAVESLSWQRQLASATNVVVARSKASPGPCDGHGSIYCHDIFIDQQLLGPPIPYTSLTFRTPAYYQKLEKWYWRAQVGLLFLRTKSDGFVPTHPSFGFLAQVGNGFVTGYRLVPDANPSGIEPIALQLSEILR